MTTPLPHESPTSPRPRPTRRALARGAAWSVPAIAVGAAAPASAASCAPWAYTLQWGGSATTTYTRTDSFSASATVTSPDPGAPTVTVGILAAGSLPVVQPRFDNLTVVDPPVGGTGQYGLLIRQVESGSGGSAPGAAFQQEVTFVFDQPVTGLMFTVTDIDSNTTTTNFVDEVYLTPAPPSVAPADGTYLQGSGTSADPLRAVSDNDPLDDSASSRGNATISYAGEQTSVTLALRNGTTSVFGSEVIQSVFLLEMSFGVVPDTC